ncbi:unnamed protein product [Leptidea sinapis]|uniref:Uncharacterized protein n=1 Tax=Leptidea sinapis TaxID=189913 RepID=A0A5E4QS79_9NEOP|nr:unnamed protein product [Leptidea sinapis]
MAHKMLEDRLITQMVIPVSKESYFNTKWKSKSKQLWKRQSSYAYIQCARMGNTSHRRKTKYM